MTLTPETIDKLRRANMANLVKKLSSGKTLTAAESKLIEAASSSQDEKELVTTSRLAEIFGLNRKSIPEWRKENRPGVPAKIDGKEDLNAWRAWFSANPSAGHFDGKPRADRESLLCEKLTIEIAIKRIELETETGALVSAAEVEEHMAAIGATMKAMLQRIENDVPPTIEGMSAAQIKTELHKHHENMLGSFDGEAARLIAKHHTQRICKDIPQVHKVEPVAVGRAKRQNPKLKPKRNIRRKNDALVDGSARVRGR
jgi:hypothetical protein